jgi:hypothetical protein
MGNRGLLRRPRQPWLRHSGAREELAGGSERESRGLGLVEEGQEVLTVEAMELRWPDAGDRRGGPFLCGNREVGKLERGGR